MWEEQAPTPPSSSQKKSFDKKILLYGAIGLVILVLVVISGYFFLQYQNAQKLLSGGNSQAQLQSVIDKVSKLVVLPSDEKPTLATVTNKFKVNSQDFFKKAENGDQVLIYTKNKTAILYRPSSNKIVNYATGITVGQGDAGTVAGENTQATVAPSPSGAVSPTEEPTPTKAPIIPTKAPSATPTETVAPIQ